MFKKLLSSLKEAIGAFDVSDVPNPAPVAPKVKKPPPVPIKALKPTAPIKNTALPGVDRMATMKKAMASRGSQGESLSAIIATARSLIEGGGSRASKELRQVKDFVRNAKSGYLYPTPIEKATQRMSRAIIKNDPLKGRESTVGKVKYPAGEFGPRRMKHEDKLAEGGGTRAAKAGRQDMAYKHFNSNNNVITKPSEDPHKPNPAMKNMHRFSRAITKNDPLAGRASLKGKVKYPAREFGTMSSRGLDKLAKLHGAKAESKLAEGGGSRASKQGRQNKAFAAHALKGMNFLRDKVNPQPEMRGRLRKDMALKQKPDPLASPAMDVTKNNKTTRVRLKSV